MIPLVTTTSSSGGKHHSKEFVNIDCAKKISTTNAITVATIETLTMMTNRRRDLSLEDDASTSSSSSSKLLFFEPLVDSIIRETYCHVIND